MLRGTVYAPIEGGSLPRKCCVNHSPLTIKKKMNNKKNALIVIQLVGYSLMALYYVYMLRKSYMEYEMTASKYETFKQTVTP